MTSQEIRTAYEQFLNDFNIDDQILAVFDWIANSTERNVSHQLGILLLAFKSRPGLSGGGWDSPALKRQKEITLTMFMLTCTKKFYEQHVQV